MDELQTIVKELRVDWEQVITDDFNPLHIALRLNSSSTHATDFRDMYNKLELAMEKIISSNYKGFSDSVLSYNEFYDGNKTILSNINSIIDMCNRARENKVNSTDLSQEYNKAVFYRYKENIISRIKHAKECFNDFENASDLFIQSEMIVECMDLLNEDLIKIKGVEEYRRAVHEKYVELVEKVNNKIDSFVFEGNSEDLLYFRCIIAMRSLGELEGYFKKNFQKRVFEAVEKTILNVFKSSEMSYESLCMNVIRKLESIKNNMGIIIDKCIGKFEIDTSSVDFYGNKSTNFKFVVDKGLILELIKNELTDFIVKYTRHPSVENMKFDLGSIPDDIDYSKIYLQHYGISKKLSGTELVSTSIKTGHTVLFSPNSSVVVYLLKYCTDYSLKSFLTTQVDSVYLKYKTQESIDKLNTIFEGDWLKMDSTNQRLEIFSEIESIVNGKDSEVSKILETLNGENNSINLNQLDEKDKSEDSNSTRPISSRKSDLISRKISQEFLLKFNQVFSSKIIIDLKDKSISSGEISASIEGNFRKYLVDGCITKKDLFNNLKSYQLVACILNTLKDLGNNVSMEVRNIYFVAFRQQIHLDFFYFYDLFYRQGNGKFYIEKMMNVLYLANEASGDSNFFDGIYKSIVYYSINNMAYIYVKSREELSEFLDHLRMMDEILSEIEFFSSLDELYRIIEGALNGKSENDAGKILLQKIKN